MSGVSFVSERDAMEFIVSEIAAEAIRAGQPLRETERLMLLFSETAANARELAEASETEGTQDEFEQRIARLIRAARKRADKQRAVAWRAAVRRVAGTDRYLAVMLDESVRGQSGAPAGRNVVMALVVISLVIAVYALLEAGLGWYLGHQPSRGERFFYTWLAAVTCAVTYMVSRWAFGTRRVDDSIGRVFDALYRTADK